MIDWSGCPLVVKREDYIGGKPALRDDPRVSPDIIVDNMDDGDTVEVVISEYDLRTSPADAQAIYDYAQRLRALVERELQRRPGLSQPA